MANIKEYNECNECIHNNICALKTEREEIYGKMLGKLDNCCCPDSFQFSFECLEFIRDIAIRSRG